METCTKNLKCTNSIWFLKRAQWECGQRLRYLKCYLAGEYRMCWGWSGLFKRTLMSILEHIREVWLTARTGQEIDFFEGLLWKVNTMFIWGNWRWGWWWWRTWGNRSPFLNHAPQSIPATPVPLHTLKSQGSPDCGEERRAGTTQGAPYLSS